MIPESIFKAYDIRGLYPGQINEGVVHEIGLRFGSFISAPEIVVGRDMRLSSGPLFSSFVQGVIDSGVNVLDIGVVSTPFLYFGISHLKAKGGVMITASHNPKEYNGFKVCREDAIPIFDVELKKLKDIELPPSQPAAKGHVKPMEIFPEYQKHVLSFVRNIGKLKIAIDAGNGMAGAIFPQILKGIEGSGITLIPLYCDLDGSFPHHEADPLKPENLRELQKAVKEDKADLGAGFDGDADRVIFVDEKGEIVRADFISALLAQEFLKREPGAAIVYDLRSSKVVRETIEAKGGRAVRCRVGHAFIKSKMRQEGAVFGGELSGHYYFRKGFTADNADIPVLMVMEILTKEKKKLSDVINPFKKYFASGEISTRVENPRGKLDEIVTVFKDGKLSREDGILIEYKDWWFNIRESNTEPLLRLNLEADSIEKMASQRDELLSIIKEK